LGSDPLSHSEQELPGYRRRYQEFESQLDEEFFLIYGIFLVIGLWGYGAGVGAKVWSVGMQSMKKRRNYSDADVAELDSDGRNRGLQR